MAFCANCGTSLDEGAVFCGNCGTRQGAQATSPPPPVAAPPPSSGGYQAGSEGLPPEPPMWDFQRSLIPMGEQLVSALGLQSASGFGAIVARIIRGTFLSPSVAREAALDEAGTGSALTALLFVNLPNLLVSLLSLGAVFRFGAFAAVITLIVGILAIIGSSFILSLLSKPILGVALSFGQLLRPLCYVQGANLLGFIPIIGFLLGIWNLVAATAAVRSISGADTGKAIVFLLVGAIIVAVAMAVFSPILLAAFAFLR